MAGNEKILSVWGSPHSGKTGISVKLAQAIYEMSRSTVIVIFCDVNTPSLPVLFPNRKENELYSLGTLLSATDIFANDVVSNLVTLRERMNLGFLGYRNRENRFRFPEYTEEKAKELFCAIGEVADHIIVDCMTDPKSSVLTEYAMKHAGRMIRLYTPDLSCMSFYQSQDPILKAGGYYADESLSVMNIPSADLSMLAGDASAYFGRIGLTLPFSQTLREQYLEGTLVMPTKDRRFMQAIRTAAEAML